MRLRTGLDVQGGGSYPGIGMFAKRSQPGDPRLHPAHPSGRCPEDGELEVTRQRRVGVVESGEQSLGVGGLPPLGIAPEGAIHRAHERGSEVIRHAIRPGDQPGEGQPAVEAGLHRQHEGLLAPREAASQRLACEIGVEPGLAAPMQVAEGGSEADRRRLAVEQPADPIVALPGIGEPQIDRLPGSPLGSGGGGSSASRPARSGSTPGAGGDGGGRRVGAAGGRACGDRVFDRAGDPTSLAAVSLSAGVRGYPLARGPCLAVADRLMSSEWPFHRPKLAQK